MHAHDFIIDLFQQFEFGMGISLKKQLMYQITGLISKST